MRILHIGKFFPPDNGGMETFLADLVAAQQAQGLEVHALVHGQPLATDPAWLVRVPVQCQLIHAPIALGFPSALAKAIQQVRPQVLHIHMPNNSAFWALTLPEAREIPWVVHWHSDVVVSQIRRAVAVAYQLYRPFEQALLQHAARIVVTSPPYLAASAPLRDWTGKCAVVPLGLPATAAGASPAASATSTKYWTSTGLRLLSIGRLVYYKGFATLIRAVANMPDVELLIAGDGPLMGELQELVQTLTPAGQTANIRLLGRVSEAEKNQLLQGCDLFCLASLERTEAFGLVLLEAMAQAKPCLVSQLAGSGMPWLIEETGAGWTVEPLNTGAWRDAVAQLQHATEQRHAMGQAGRHAVEKHFTMDRCAQHILREYRLAQALLPTAPRRAEDILVVIPAKDEANTIGTMLVQLREKGWEHVLVIDDHSTDGTGEIARAAGAQVVRPSLPVGAWGGMQTGLRHAVRQGFGGVVTMDADGQHGVDDIPALLAARNQGSLVIGAYPERASTLRQLAWRWFRQLAGFDLRDLTSGFRLYQREAIAVLAEREATMLDYQDLGALLLVRRAGLKIVEVPVTMNVRAVGKSKIFNSWFNVLRYMAATTLLCLARGRTRRTS